MVTDFRKSNFTLSCSICITVANSDVASTDVFPIFLGGSFGFSFSNITHVFWTQPQLADGLGENMLGQTPLVFSSDPNRDEQAHVAPADSGHWFVISHVQSWSVLQEMNGFGGVGVEVG